MTVPSSTRPTIRDRETAKYRAAWSQEIYRQACHGLDLWRRYPQYFTKPIDRAIDLGCGLGLLLDQWQMEGIEPWGVDLVPEVSLAPHIRDQYAAYVYTATLWDFHPGQQFDLGVCADVMEHMPPERVGDVLQCIRACCRRVVFKIANFPSTLVGEDLHLCLRPAHWWQRTLEAELAGEVRQMGYVTGRDEYVFVWERAYAETPVA